MIPIESEESYTLKCKLKEGANILVITENSLRHKNLINSLHKEFQSQNIYAIILNSSSNKFLKLYSIFKEFNFNNLRKVYLKFGIFEGMRQGWKHLLKKLKYLIYLKKIKVAEKKIIGSVDVQLPKSKINYLKRSDINTEIGRHKVKNINPDYLVTLGGPKYSREIINSAKYLSINQHAGYSPFYKGSYTTEWAHYRKDYKKIGATVHLLSNDLDGGDILFRSKTVSLNFDKAEEVFIRNVLNGTSLIIEAFRNIIKEESVILYKQDGRLEEVFKKRDFLKIL